MLLYIDYTHQLRSSIELTLRQKTVPSALIDLHQRAEEPVTGEEIAHEIERSPGAIRNQMRTLAALNSVEGRRGPRGGYKPTSTAYEALNLQQLDHPAEGPVVHKGEPVGGEIVERIDLTNVYHSTHCRAELTLQGSLTPFHEADTLRLGPTPLSKLVIEGAVEGRDETSNVLLIEITTMKAPAEEQPLPA